MSAKNGSLKWISVKRSRGSNELVVNKEVKEKVFDPYSRQKCNLVSIFGAARQGKSFMMNCLAGTTGLFNISNLSEPCTQGIDISNHMVDLETFSSIDGGQCVKDKCKVGFVDAEGQGDQDVTYDANLVCPILLASKCVILNWKDSLQKDKILNHLGIMHKAAINVAMEGDLEDDSHSLFGHLHLVFRDWQYTDSDEKSVLKDIFKEERSSETAAAVRNQIRRSVKESFQSINVWLFPPPVSNATKLRDKLTINMVETPFRDKLRSFRNSLSSQLKEPMFFDGKPLVGRKLGLLVETVSAVLNSGETVCPQPAWISMSSSEVSAIRVKLERELREKVDAYLDELSSLCDDCSRPDSKFETKNDADEQAKDFVRLFQEEYSDEVQNVVGSLEGELANQVLRPSQEVVDRIKSDALARIEVKYMEILNRWLQKMVNITQEATKAILDELHSSLPLPTEELETEMSKRCEKICGMSSLQHGSDDYSLSSDQLQAISQQLTLYSDSLFEQFRQTNNKLLAQCEAKVDEIYGASISNITSRVAQILASYEMAGEHDVLSLDSQLRDLNKCFNREKEQIASRIKEITPLNGSSHSSILEEAESMAVKRLEEECSGLAVQVEDAYLTAAKKYYRASAERGTDFIEKESRKLLQGNNEGMSTEALRHKLDELVSKVLLTEEERGRGWECPQEVVTQHLLEPIKGKVEKVYENLCFLNEQLRASRNSSTQPNEEMDVSNPDSDAQATAEADALARTSGQRKRRQTTLLTSEQSAELESNQRGLKRRKTKAMSGDNNPTRRTKAVTPISDDDEDVEESKSADMEVVVEKPSSKRMSVQEQRASARRYAEEKGFLKPKATAKKTSRGKNAKNVNTKPDTEEEATKSTGKPLSKLELAKKQQSEMLNQRAQEKIAQIRSSSRTSRR